MAKNKNILVLTGWSYRDALIQVYTLPYVRIMRQVIPAGVKLLLVTFEQDARRLTEPERLQVRKELAKEGITWLGLRYYKPGPAGYFLIAAQMLKLATRVVTQGIGTIHAWCMPAGSMGYLISLVTGKKLIIDSYEPHAEAMVENGTWKRNSFRFRLLFALEKRLSHRAAVIISATEGMRAYALKKYDLVPAHFYVKPACVDISYFSKFTPKDPSLLRELKLEGKITAVYSGKFGGIYLTKEVFDFFRAAADYWGDRFRVLLLTGHPSDELETWARQSGFDWKNVVLKLVPASEMPVYLGLADFALTPVKPVPTKRYCTPIKDGEYWAMGLPVVITPNISDDSDLIEKNNAGFVLPALDPASYAAVVKKMDAFLSSPNIEDLKTNIRQLASSHRNLLSAVPLYTEVYTTLVFPPAHPPQ